MHIKYIFNAVDSKEKIKVLIYCKIPRDGKFPMVRGKGSSYNIKSNKFLKHQLTF